MIKNRQDLQPPNLPEVPPNVWERQKKDPDAEIRQPIPVDVAIYINNLKKMSNFLFAIDSKTEEVIVSESPKGSKSIHFIERIRRNENELLYNAVVTLTSISHSADFNPAIFKAMDKVCQMIYNMNKENNI